MKRFLLTLVTLLSLAGFNIEAQTDNFISQGSVSPYIVLGRGLAWGGAGQGTISQNFIFHPVNPDEGFCLFINNNNPVSGHNVTVAVFQTGDPALQVFNVSPQKWFTVPTALVLMPVNIPASSVIGINYKTNASAGITIQFTSNIGAGGSPDTADIFAVQTTLSTCGGIAATPVQGPFPLGTGIGPAQEFPVLIGGTQDPATASSVKGFAVGGFGSGFPLDGPIPTFNSTGNTSSPGSWFTAGCEGPGNTERVCLLGVMPIAGFANFAGSAAEVSGFVRTNILEAGADISNFANNNIKSFWVQNSITNPGTGVAILHLFNQANSTVNATFKNLVVACSAICELQILRTTAQGTTCSAVTIHNFNIYTGSRLAPDAHEVAEKSCTGQPTASDVLYDLTLSAGSVQNIDLSGIVNMGTTTGAGIEVFNVTTLTGIASATFNWVELQ